MNVVSRARGLALMSLFAVGAVASEAAAQNRDGLVDQVRAANARFNDVSVAVAEGYAPIPCASGVDGGAMGVHYVNPNYLKDTAVDIKRPQAVMYEPTPDGKMAAESRSSPREIQNYLGRVSGPLLEHLADTSPHRLVVEGGVA